MKWLINPDGNTLGVCTGGGTTPCFTDADCVGTETCTQPSVEEVLSGQKHQGLIAAATGVAGTELDVDQSLNPPQTYSWELKPNGEVLGAPPGEPDPIRGPPIDLDGDGLADGPIGAPIPMDPTVPSSRRSW